MSRRSDQESLDLMQSLTLWQYPLILGGVVAFCFRILLELLALVNDLPVFFCALPESGRVCHPLGERL